MSGSIKKPTDILNFGMTHEEQIELVQFSQEVLLKAVLSQFFLTNELMVTFGHNYAAKA